MYHFWCLNISKIDTVQLSNAFKAEAWSWLKDLATLSYQTIWKDCINVTSIAVRLLTQLSFVGLIIVLVSFIKCLTPKYNFNRSKDPIDLTTDRKSLRPKRSGKQASSFVQKILEAYEDECVNLSRGHQYALAETDAKCLYKRLSWYHTQLDLESLNWLNRSIRAFWPSIKTLLYKFVLFDLLRPKPDGHGTHPFSSNNVRMLSRKQAQLSILISTRRKLNQLRDLRERQLKEQSRPVLVKFVIFLLSAIRFSLIHLRQFMMDCLMSLVKPSEQDIKRRAAMFLPDHLAAILRKNLGARESKPITKQPMASHKKPNEVKSLSLIKDNKASKASKSSCRRSRTAPARVRTTDPRRQFHIYSGFFGQSKVIKRLRNKRIRLVRNINKNYEKSLHKKEFQIERIRLGKQFPTINGIRIVEDGDSRRLASDQDRSVDEANMKFITEVSYDSDDKFLIQIGSIPWLKRIRLTQFSVQVRVMLTINHTAFSANKELDVFQTTGDVLFPAINYVQVTLMDVPAINWTIRRPKTRIKPVNGSTSTVSHTFKAWYLSYRDKIKAIVDPVAILDSSYLKYLVHCIMLAVMKWFQPFDIKVGPLLYLKTMY